MANSKQALKRVRQNAKRNATNTALKSRVKTLRKNSIAAAAAGDADVAKKAYQQFTSAVDKAAKKNIFHKNKAANLKSKTAKAIVAAQAA
ncbi:30S ribosomal protein S20 [Rubritalea marina]|uniref:30S ribosomal protein S20 n=1 Tax=Rubritalea marina TaxID=361055 RepID=UPI000379D9D5|nr:30S ribosomal protein S20 [Rubritalea marina]